MKFYTIAMMLFLLSLSVSIINQLDVMNINLAYQKDWVDKINSNSYQNQTYSSGLTPDSSNLGGDFLANSVIALKIFGKSLLYSTIGMPYMLTSFGLNMDLAILIALPIWLIYFVAVIQIFIGTGFEGMK